MTRAAARKPKTFMVILVEWWGVVVSCLAVAGKSENEEDPSKLGARPSCKVAPRPHGAPSAFATARQQKIERPRIHRGVESLGAWPAGRVTREQAAIVRPSVAE
ncbi:hypothetical protein ON010_g9137 [Phytophthora cinnamomi]|nr:hypothetical protein ON010_g9137 [Phytophthora cinnamomi]